MLGNMTKFIISTTLIDFPHRSIRNLITSLGYNDFHVGINDRGVEGVWRKTDGGKYLNGEGHLYVWNAGEPNNKYQEGYGSHEDCCVIRERSYLNDLPCTFVAHGLCEIKTYKC